MERFFRDKKLFACVVAVALAAITAAAGFFAVVARDKLSGAAPALSHTRQPDKEASSRPDDGASPAAGVDGGAPSGEGAGPADSGPGGGAQGTDTPDAGEREGAGGEGSDGAPQEGAQEGGAGEAGEAPAGGGEASPGGVPEEMRAVYLTPGVDYPVQWDGQATRAGIDAALAAAKELTMNTVVALVDYEGKPLYARAGAPAPGGMDVLKTLLARARANGMYVYLLLDGRAAGGGEGPLTLKAIDRAAEAAGELAKNYPADGLLLDGYLNPAGPGSYAAYISAGTGMGYQEYLRAYPLAMVRAVAGAVRQRQPQMRVGLLAGGVWQNAADDGAGSATAAPFAALRDGNADTRGFVLAGLADFVAVQPAGATESGSEPYREVVRWWASLCQGQGVPLYVVHQADKICTEAAGYQSPDELAQEVIYAREAEGFRGSIYNSLGRLRENPQQSTDLLLKLYANQLNVEHVLTRLAVTKPEAAEFSTFEPSMVFRGASDPNFEVTLDGERLETDENGYFTVTRDLAAGLNEFMFAHKGKTQTFRITRNVQIIKEVTPTGSVTLEGGMQLQITALAYADAAVSASLSGVIIPMAVDEAVDDETDDDSAYVRFKGVYMVPAAGGAAQPLGAITVSGSWGGIGDSQTGATVTVNPAVAAGDGDLVVVTADAAKTYPTGRLSNESDPGYFPLPAGTLDYTVGDVLTYKNSEGTYEFYKLQSGVRVSAKDISRAEGTLSTGNTIESMKISSDKRYTYVKLATRQKVPYLVRYSPAGIQFDFQYTSAAPASREVENNPVIAAAGWEGSTLTLRFVKEGAFLGYHAYYEGDVLVLRLINPPTSLGGVRVAIDPGHGGKDKGAPGYYPDVNESEVNLAIAEQAAAALEARGAKVKLLATTPYINLTERLQQARAFDADIFISIHANTNADASATGTEVYYFYPSGRQLAAAAAGRVADALGTHNRGAKQANYYVTTDSRFASVLVECGFISNKNEYKKLIKPAHQAEVAEGIADAVEAYLGAVGTGIAGGSGEEEEGGEGEEESGDEEEAGEGDGGGEAGGTALTGLGIDQAELALAVGDSARLQALPAPAEAGPAVEWLSSDEGVATVNAKGKVRAVGAGTALITASAQGFTAQCRVEVAPE